ncbi:MAG: hypothetical protein Q8S03_10315 [Brevundimonas sp.]|uniref:hypothetical protein n=1 Tax=Brevundimonas sp. TaxID=1871086 RepID=UPI002734629D|nr:hypothetical protein [Brevundimonas sp.]MDP3405073.1 hypothetical protein [Brevundimonas sp.]
MSRRITRQNGMTSRPTLTSQAAWAQGQAAQHARIAARATPNSVTRKRALERAELARAAAESLSAMAAMRRALSPETQP